MSTTENKKPESLEEAIQAMDKIFSLEQNLSFKEEFKNRSENECMHGLHHGFGTSIRNDWGLWKQDSPLHEWFLSRGIFHPDDMSGIIITSYHKWLNQRDLSLDKQIQHYLDFWKKSQMENCCDDDE
jgi:hypothetical protein